MPDTSDIKHALNQLSLTAGQLKPHSIGYLTGFEPNRDDIAEFQNDLVILAGKLDAVIDAYGAYLESLGCIGAVDRRIYFNRPMMDAIEGNALYAIENGIEQRIEDRETA